MKKKVLIIISILAILVLLVWFSCNPMNLQENKSNSISSLDETDTIKATGDYGCIGFGSGVTGGEGGAIVYVSDYATFKSYTDSNTPYIIYVTGSFNLNGMECHVRSDKTIIGQGNVVLSGGGLYLYKSSNVIIKNLTIRNSTEDGIGIHYSNTIWIDHCTIYDCADGLIDITQASDYITVSWCKFYYTGNYGHNYANLIASSDSDNGSQYHVTFHHNWWGDYVVERMPSVRFGRVHVFNNYFNAPGNNYCIRTRIDAEILVENNFFENVKNPWEQYVTGATGTQGKLRAVGNNIGFMDTSYGCTWYVDPNPGSDGQSFLIPGTDTVFTPPYSYTLETASTAKQSVISGAGAK